MLNLPSIPPRIIPSLLLQDDVFVKTKKFRHPAYIGDPVNTINLFNKFEVDEIVLLDIGTARRGGAPNFSLISDLASECWVPLSYGGGIRNVEQARLILNSGIEKIILETLLFTDPEEVRKCVRAFGASSVVGCLNVMRNIWGRYEVRTQAGRKTVKGTFDKILKQISALGIGELILHDISRDGMRAGYDIELIRHVAARVDIPVISLGGASGMNDFKAAIDAGASAVSAGAFFVFQGQETSGVLVNYPNRNDIEDLFNGR